MHKRDIRDDLRERLAAIPRQREDLRERLTTLDEYEGQLRGLLEIEDKLAANGSAGPPRTNEDEGTKAQKTTTEQGSGEQIRVATDEEFEADLLDILGGEPEGHAWAHSAIKEEMERKGWSSQQSLGRQIHGTLMALRHRGLVELVGQGVWRKPPSNENRGESPGLRRI